VLNTKTESHPKLLFVVPAISQTHKILKILKTFCQDQDQDFYLKTKTKTLGLKTKTKTKTKTLFFVLEAPRDQDFGLEDYITAENRPYAADWSDVGIDTRRRVIKLLFNKLKRFPRVARRDQF